MVMYLHKSCSGGSRIILRGVSQLPKPYYYKCESKFLKKIYQKKWENVYTKSENCVND